MSWNKLGRKNVTQLCQYDNHKKLASSRVMKKTKQLAEETYAYNKYLKQLMIKHICILNMSFKILTLFLAILYLVLLLLLLLFFQHKVVAFWFALFSFSTLLLNICMQAKVWNLFLEIRVRIFSTVGSKFYGILMWLPV